MAWRQERRRNWLKKIATGASCRDVKVKVKQTQTTERRGSVREDLGNISDESIAENGLSEGEIREPARPSDKTGHPTKKRRKGRRKKPCKLWLKGTCIQGTSCPDFHDVKRSTQSKPLDAVSTEAPPKTLYTMVGSTDSGLTVPRCWKIKWNGRISCYCKSCCIFGSMDC